MKVDGCGAPAYYDHGYQAVGEALEESLRALLVAAEATVPNHQLTHIMPVAGLGVRLERLAPVAPVVDDRGY